MITFTTLFTSAHLVILSPVGYRDPKQIHRIVREKAACPGRDGLHRGMAVAQDAGIPLQPAGDEVPGSTKESQLMSKDLKKRGFSFVGPVTCYAFMQAIGMVNDHITDCFRWRDIRGESR